MRELSTPVEIIISTLTSKFAIEQIYLSNHDGGASSKELIVLVSNKYLKIMGEMVPRIGNAIREFSEFKVHYFVLFQAKDRIRDGNLFLFTSCLPEKLIYKKEGSEVNLMPVNVPAFSKKVYELRDKEFQKVAEFKEGYYFYKGKEQFSMAAFMLHQTLELTYKYLEVLLCAKERFKHSIRGHHLYLKEITTGYNSVFDEHNELDQHLLNILEDVYRATRYEINFDINLPTLVLMEEKMLKLQDNAAKIYESALASFDRFISTSVNKSDLITKDEFSEIQSFMVE